MKTLQHTIRAVLCLSVSAMLFIPGCAAPELGDDIDDNEIVEEEVADGVDDGMDEENVAEAESELVAWCNDTLTWNSSWASFESQVITLVNQKRAAGATCGGVKKPPVPALIKDDRLRCAGRKHSKDMSTNNFFSHTGSNGSTHSQRMTKAGYTWTSAGENIGGGSTTPAQVVNGWMNSSGHCNGIMNGNYKHIGVGYSYNANATWKHYWTLDFGRP